MESDLNECVENLKNIEAILLHAIVRNATVDNNSFRRAGVHKTD